MVVADLEETRNELDKAMEYITLYGKYVEVRSHTSMSSNLLDLWENAITRMIRKLFTLTHEFAAGGDSAYAISIFALSLRWWRSSKQPLQLILQILK